MDFSDITKEQIFHTFIITIVVSLIGLVYLVRDYEGLLREERNKCKNQPTARLNNITEYLGAMSRDIQTILERLP